MNIIKELNNILNKKYIKYKDPISKICATRKGKIPKSMNNISYKAFNFDNIARTLYPKNTLSSVDMLHIKNNILYLIEFKQMKIFTQNKKKFCNDCTKKKVKLKGIESLIIIQELLNDNINNNFKRVTISQILNLNIHYYIVCYDNILYQKNISNRKRIAIKANLANIPKYENSFFKKVEIYHFNDFKNIINQIK